MIVYIAVDKENGLMFNNRRQSQDRILREDILKSCGQGTLWMNEYTYKLFQWEENGDVPENIMVDNDFFAKAQPEDSCYVETDTLTSRADSIDTLVLYYWNRTYPADLYFDTAVLKDLNRISKQKFKGFSHETIIKEVWKRA